MSPCTLPACLPVHRIAYSKDSITQYRRNLGRLVTIADRNLPFFFITSPAALAAHETGREHFKPPATSSSVDPALSIEAFYLGNFKGRDGVPRRRRLT